MSMSHAWQADALYRTVSQNNLLTVSAIRHGLLYTLYSVSVTSQNGKNIQCPNRPNNCENFLKMKRQIDMYAQKICQL